MTERPGEGALTERTLSLVTVAKSSLSPLYLDAERCDSDAERWQFLSLLLWFEDAAKHVTKGGSCLLQRGASRSDSTLGELLLANSHDG